MEKDFEQNLVEEIKQGNKKAETEFYKYYKTKLSRILRKQYPNNGDHEDDVSELMMKIFENLDRYDTSKSRFNTWVTNIVKNYMIDKSRKKKHIYVNFSAFTNNSDGLDFSDELDKMGVVGVYYNSFNMNEPQSSAYNPYQSLEISDSINHIFNSVNNVEYSMLTLKYCEGYDYKEIGSEFNMKDSQVSNKINYTKTKLKKKLNE